MNQPILSLMVHYAGYTSITKTNLGSRPPLQRRWLDKLWQEQPAKVMVSMQAKY